MGHVGGVRRQAPVVSALLCSARGAMQAAAAASDALAALLRQSRAADAAVAAVARATMSRAATPQTRDLPACLRRFGIGHSDEACGAGGPRGPAMDALSRMPLKELMSLHIARSVDPGGDQGHSALAEGHSPRRRRSVAVGRGRALSSRDGPRSFPSYGDGGGEWYTQSLKPAAALRQQEEFAHISDDEVRGALARRLRRSRGEALTFGVCLLRELAMLLLPHPTILRLLPLPPHRLV